ncbi:MAG TPA: DUF2798 domain-containing protein [Burkholderiales bacterium]|nr:DUF2798 domain-containing protein [Burkholderiales bacterium]
MKLPRRYANLLFGAMLSLIMVTIVSGIVLLMNHGLGSDFPLRWLRSVATTWPIAFPTVLIVAPWVRRTVDKMTEP